MTAKRLTLAEREAEWKRLQARKKLENVRLSHLVVIEILQEKHANIHAAIVVLRDEIGVIDVKLKSQP